MTARALQTDIVAGLTVALVGLPQCLAYALMSGLPPAYGLSTAVVAGLIAALLGRSPQIVTGPTNTTGLLVLGALLPYLSEHGLLRPAGLPALATLTLLAGLIRIVAALLGGAQLLRLLPGSVLVGFTAGAGILIGTMQLDEALGLSVRAGGLWPQLRAVAAGADATHGLAVGVTLATVFAIALGQRFARRWPVALLAVLAAAGVAGLLGLGQGAGLPIVAERSPLPSGWPPGALPNLDPALLRQFLVPASAIVLLGTLELAVSARAGGARPDMKREILAQGIANTAASVASGFPASASLTRSALLRLGGARTRLAAVVGAILTAPILLFAGRLVGWIPQASLAGVLLFTAWRMIDRAAIARMWRAAPETRLLLVLTLAATLLLPLEWAILIGSGTGLLIHIAKTSAPRLRLLSPDGERLVPVAADSRPGIVVLEVSGNLHYAAVPPFLDEAERLIPDSARKVVIDLSHAHEIRYAALLALERLAEELARDGADLLLAGVSDGTRALIDRTKSGLPFVPAEAEPGLSVKNGLARLLRRDA